MAYHNIQQHGFDDDFLNGQANVHGIFNLYDSSQNMEDLVPPQWREDDCDDGKLTTVIESTIPQASWPLHIYGAQVNFYGTFTID